jgi:hypothetical protein
MTHWGGIMIVGDATSIILGLHGIYWPNFHQNPQALEQSYPLNFVNGWKKTYFVNMWWWITMGFSYTWTSSTQSCAMTIIFCTNLTSTKFGVNIVYILMSTYSTILVTWAMIYSWCLALGGMNWCLKLIWI